MDMVTLAMAKAYTDSKVGGGELVIDLDEYGIDIISLVLSGGGKVFFNNTASMWETIGNNRNVVFKASPVEGFDYYMKPVLAIIGDDYNTYSTYLAIDMDDGMLTANITIYSATNNGYKDVAVVCAAISQIPIPG